MLGQPSGCFKCGFLHGQKTCLEHQQNIVLIKDERISELEKEHEETLQAYHDALNECEEEASRLEAALEQFSKADNWALRDGDYHGETFLVWTGESDPRRIVKQALRGGE